MKKNFLLLCLLVATLNVLAYPFDVIITKSREQVQCIILSRTEELITYQLVNDNSQTFTLNTSDVEKIYSRDNGPVISYVPEPVHVKTSIAEKPKPVEEKKAEPAVEKEVEQIEPIKEEVKEPNPVVDEPKVVETPQKETKTAPEKKNIALTEDELQFKLFMTSINGPDLEQYRAERAKEAEKKEVLSQNIISIFVTGLKDDKADIQQVIESEALAKLGALKDNKAQIEVASKGITDDSIIAIAKEHLSKFAFIVNVRPFQKQFYMQSKLIDVANGKLLTSASAASSLTSLEDLLKTMDTLTTHVVEHFQKQIEETKAKVDAEQNVIVDFDIERTSDPFWCEFINHSSGATDFRWDFGDGTFGFAKEAAIRVYDKPGTYVITLTANVGDKKFVKKKVLTIENKQPTEDSEVSQEQLQESIDNLGNAINNLKQTVNSYGLVIFNTTKHSYKINLDGHILGVVAPYKTEKYLVPIEWYGRMQAIQTSGYINHPTIKEFKIPQQKKHANISVRL